MATRLRRFAVATIVGGVCVTGAAAQPARAINLLKPVCAVGGLISGLAGKACNAVQHGGQVLSAGKKLLTGHLGSAVKTLAGGAGGSIASKATFALGLAAVVTWVTGGARYALKATASVISHTTTPQLQSTWFSATYWRVAGIAAVLTLPFLFAAVIQALVRSDLALLARAAFGFLPLAMLGVGIAAPLTMLLLAATDQLSAVVSSAAGHATTHFLTWASAGVGGLALLSSSPFLVFFVGLLTVAAAIVLWFELLLRAVAVYVIVLMLPLAFAALVWPARRIWAIRAVEVLVALILSKFLIVAVLSLGGAALNESAFTSITGMLAGFVLLTMGVLTPWALLRLLPLGEIASAAAGSLRSEAVGAGSRLLQSGSAAGTVAHDWAYTTAQMRRDANGPSNGGELDGQPPTAASASDAQAAEDLVGDAVPAASNGGAPEEGSAESGDSEPAAPGGPVKLATGAGSAGNGTSSAAANDPPDPTAAASPPRAPGMAPIWQSDDYGWGTVKLGLEHGWPPRPIADADGTAADPPSAADHADGRAGPRPAREPDRPTGDHEDHDPTPDPQPPEDGPL
jgi:type IV secretion system protein TrbL